ncbi:MAG: DUF359 domain-containing protein [Candidatus Geothermarchaeota archaeon]
MNCNIEGIYLFSEELSEEVRKPLGKVYTQENFHELVSEIAETRSKNLFIVTVGDRVTLSLLNIGITPDVAIIDMKERRERATPINKRNFNRVLNAINEKGTINMNLCKVIRDSLKYRPVLIVIEGEEDLVGFPAVLALPVGSLMLYGLPNVGVVMVRVNDSVKEHALKLLKRCKKIG